MSDRTVKVATWNCNNGISDDGTVYRFVSGGVGLPDLDGVDILAAQEVPFVDGSPDKEFIDLITSAGLVHYAAFELSGAYNRERIVRSGLVLAAQGPLETIELRAFQNPELVAPVDGKMWRSDDKGYVAARVRLGRLSAALACTHLLPFADFGVALDSFAATAPWIELEEFARSALAENDFAVVAGDFNRSVPQLGPLQSIAYDVETRDTNESVDTVYVSSAVRVAGLEVIRTRSDHHAVIATLILEE